MREAIRWEQSQKEGSERNDTGRVEKEIRPLMKQVWNRQKSTDKDRKTIVFSGKAGGCSDTDGGDQRDPGIMS